MKDTIGGLAIRIKMREHLLKKTLKEKSKERKN